MKQDSLFTILVRGTKIVKRNLSNDKQKISQTMNRNNSKWVRLVKIKSHSRADKQHFHEIEK